MLRGARGCSTGHCFPTVPMGQSDADEHWHPNRQVPNLKLEVDISWRTILTKRESFRKAFKQFDFNKIAEFSDKDIERLLRNEKIVRHRGKIEATINNAKRAKAMVETEGSLAAFFWRYEPEFVAQQPQKVSTSPESIALSKELKKRGWKFVGPTTCYAFMQAMGMVNDHFKGCDFSEQKAIISN